MGGLGSGDWYRWDRKTTAEEVRRLDIRYMHRHCGIRHPGSVGNISWSRDGEPTGSISYQVEAECLTLNYRYRSYDQDWTQYRESIQLDRTPCNYGGDRLWFLCPKCSIRVAILYGAGVRFLCRHCYDLSYASQNETYMDRMARKARKIRCRLGADEYLDVPIWEKPKGMHWSTFERLRQEEAMANQASTAQLLAKLIALEESGWAD